MDELITVTRDGVKVYVRDDQVLFAAKNENGGTTVLPMSLEAVGEIAVALGGEWAAKRLLAQKGYLVSRPHRNAAKLGRYGKYLMAMFGS